MKNFTNSFKQFTSRLSARWLIMALMLLVGTSSAWGANVYITTTSTNKINFYTWNNTCNSDGWPGVSLTSGATKNDNANGGGFYKFPKSGDCSDNSYNYIINGSGQTGDLSISSTTWGVYNGSNTFTVLMTEANMSSTSITFRSDALSGWSTNTSTAWDATKKKYKTAEVNYSKQSGIDVYIAGTKFIYKAPANFDTPATGNYIIYWDPYTSDITFETPCPTSVTPGTASITSVTPICSGGSASLKLADNTANTDIQWQKSPTSSSNDFTDITDATNATYTASDITATTYFRAKVTIPASGTCSAVTGYSNEVTVSLKAAPTKPAITLNPADGKIVAGEHATLTVTAQDDVTFTLYREGVSTGTTGNSFTIEEEGTYHVVGINSCEQESPASDEKTITICTPNATLLSATYNQLTDKIDLNGNLTETCGKTIFYGFLWKVKGNNWDTNNAISGTGNSLNSTSTNNTEFSQSWANAEDGTTYVFTAYALDASSGNPSTYVWYYNETGIEVSKCITITEPNITAAPICTGSTAILTLNNKQTGVTYTLNDIPIFTDNDTYTTPPLTDNTDYTIIATSVFSCPGVQDKTATVTVQVEQIPAAPAITDEATICPNTDTPLSNFNNGVANVVWYSDQDCTQPATNANINGSKSYYARTQSGICYSEVAQLDLSVYPAPAQPGITPSGTITVGQGKTATITVNNYDANVTYTCYQEENVVGSWDGATLSIVAGSTLGETEYRIVASNPNCPNLTEETSFTIDVTESGAKIAQLGNLSLCTNIVTDFVPMYVSNDGIADFADQGATKVKSYTWQYSTNGTSWDACSTSNYNATAVGMENGGKKCNNWRAAKTGQYRCLITYATDNDVEVGSQPSNVLTVTASSGTAPAVNAFGDLPIISVNTGSNAFPSDPASGYPSADADNMKKKISVDVKIFDKQGKVHYDRKARMNYRGSSSLNFQKKSYAFVTGKEKTKNTAGDVDTGKANLFGLSNGAEDKDWVLYAANPDPSMMRNRLAFDLYKEMTGKWGVSSMYVELIINNEYKGVYVLMDKVTNNEKRVNITATNGFIVKFDKTDVVDRVENQSGDQKTFATTRTGTGVNSRYPNGITSYGTEIDQRFEIEYPEKEDIEDAGGNWTETYTIIKDRFEEFEEALAEKDYATVRKLIDYDSWADWFIISEYIKNQDTYRASNIFVFNGDKIEAWPLWDQELSFNNQTRVAHGSESTSGLMATTASIYSDAFKAVFWLTGGGANGDGGLLGDPCFVALVKSKWEGYKANQLSASAIANKVNAYHTELGNAQAREEARWPYTGAKRGLTSKGATTGYYGKNEGNEVGYTSSKNAITSWATGRIAGLTTALANYTTEDLIFGISPETAPATPWQPVILTVSVPEGFEYTITYPELTQAGAIVTKTNDIYQVKIPRPTGDGWTTGGNGTDVNGNATAQPKTFTVTASITKSTENACGSVNKDEATATITLTDVTEDCNPEIVKQQQ